MKFMKPCRTDIKIPFAFQKDVHTYAVNSIYGVRLQFIVGDRLAKKSSSTLLYCLEKNVDGHVREEGLNFNFSIQSIKLNYGDIFSFPNKLKFDYSNICTKPLIMEHKIKPSDTLISLQSNIWMLKYFGLLKHFGKLQTF